VTALDADTALDPLGAGHCRATLSERWWVGRGPFGGYLAALLVRALEQVVEWPPRSLSVHFLEAPAAGPVDVRAVVERRGRSSASASLRIEQHGRPVVLALGAAGAWRPDEARWADAAMPSVSPPEAGAQPPATSRGCASTAGRSTTSAWRRSPTTGFRPPSRASAGRRWCPPST
jgi:acyl-CoA thioesterase